MLLMINWKIKPYFKYIIYLLRLSQETLSWFGMQIVLIRIISKHYMLKPSMFTSTETISSNKNIAKIQKEILHQYPSFPHKQIYKVRDNDNNNNKDLSRKLISTLACFNDISRWPTSWDNLSFSLFWMFNSFNKLWVSNSKWFLCFSKCWNQSYEKIKSIK